MTLGGDRVTMRLGRRLIHSRPSLAEIKVVRQMVVDLGSPRSPGRSYVPTNQELCARSRLIATNSAFGCPDITAQM